MSASVAAQSAEFSTTHFQQQRGEACILACVLGSMTAIDPAPGPFLCLDNCAAAVTPPVPPPTMSTLWCVCELRSSRHWVLVVSARAIVVAARAAPLANTTWANLDRNIGLLPDQRVDVRTSQKAVLQRFPTLLGVSLLP